MLHTALGLFPAMDRSISPCGNTTFHNLPTYHLQVFKGLQPYF
jgi:hypothetical protein